jgi:hypothetical protein
LLFNATFAVLNCRAPPLIRQPWTALPFLDQP